MLDYKECSMIDFTEAMKYKNSDLSTISNEHLFILYTKYYADALHCHHVGTSYAHSIGKDSYEKAESYKLELLKRGCNV